MDTLGTLIISMVVMLPRGQGELRPKQVIVLREQGMTREEAQSRIGDFASYNRELRETQIHARWVVDEKLPMDFALVRAVDSAYGTTTARKASRPV